jgi:integrase
MARRSGQVGYEEVKGDWYHVRFRNDVEKRAYLSKPICPVSGPGALKKLERFAKSQHRRRPFVGGQQFRCEGNRSQNDRGRALSENDHKRRSSREIRCGVGSERGRFFPRTWNHDFIDLPEIENQRQPTFSSETMKAIVEGSKGRERMLFILLGSTGMRIGEALGLEIGKHRSEDFSVLHIRQKVWHGSVQYFLKTKSGDRDIDLHPTVAAELKRFVGDRTAGFLFCSKTGRPLLLTNVLGSRCIRFSRIWVNPRPFMYVDDCVEGLMRLMATDYVHPLNLGTEELVSIDGLVDLVSKIAGKRLIKRHDLSKPQGVRGRNSDNSRLRQVLGWEPSIPLERGLEVTYNWIYGELSKAKQESVKAAHA